MAQATFPASRTHPSSARWARASIALALLIALALPAAAASDPTAEVKNTVDQVISILKNPAYRTNRQERRQKLRAAILPHFDFEAMSRSAMGYHWRSLTGAQRQEFSSAFTGLMEVSYTGKIESYHDQTIEYVKSFNNAPDDAQVNTEIISKSGGEPIHVNYRLKKNADGDWKVYDVLIDNISLVGNYRNQFNRVMNQSGFDGLVKAIKAKETQIDAGK
jgi:phospholipid transport system substrate-binding protein